MPNQVYRFDPDTGDVRVVADRFDKCNGIVFSPDGKTAFVYAPCFSPARVFLFLSAATNR